MKTHILTEASKTPLEKMQDVNIGVRKQNWGACSDDKLKMYYGICLSNHLEKAASEAEKELIARGDIMWLAPRIEKLDYVHSSVAQYVWSNRETFPAIVKDARDVSSVTADTLRPSEFMIRALILAVANGDAILNRMIKYVKQCIKSYYTYSDMVPGLLSELLKRPEFAAKISKAWDEVDYSR